MVITFASFLEHQINVTRDDNLMAVIKNCGGTGKLKLVPDRDGERAGETANERESQREGERAQDGNQYLTLVRKPVEEEASLRPKTVGQ